MLLHALLRQFDPSLSLSGIPNTEITAVEEDSRRVRPGCLFFARSGTKTDGRQFIPDAAARGAVAAVAESRSDAPIPTIVVPDAAAATGRIAHLFHGEPSKTLRVLGVTGTNGKTTTVYLLHHLLNSVGKKCGMIGTVRIDDGLNSAESEMTTPGAVDLARLMAQMRDSGCVACAMEVSSHALDQHRDAGIRFAGAGFTNLSQDHFDYHENWDNYAAAKALLFERLDPDATAAVNADDKWTPRIIQNCRAHVSRWGFELGANYRAQDICITSNSSNFVLVTPDGTAPVKMHLVGKHNIANALLAAALAMETMGMSVHAIACALANASGAPGRLQAVRCGQSFAVLVDYAHSDDALINVLSALRPLTKGKLRLLFGCGGERDTKKRPKMAVAAEAGADAIYVTSDNPRTEDPGAIIEQILTGFSPDIAQQKTLVVEPDRRAAIERILADAQSGDVILLAGKGHENYQDIAGQKRHFDDVEEAQRVLKAGVTT